MGNQVEKKMEHETDTAITFRVWGLKYFPYD